MRTGYALLLALGYYLIPTARARFTLRDIYVGRDFLDGWTWETLDDPTHGRVNYVGKDAALASNLTFATPSKFVMRADSFKRVGPNDRGRDSIRIISNNAYDEAVIVLDLQHMPEGCATWPAFWSLSQRGPWPNGGEVDFIEGVNLQANNLASLHTTPNCIMPDARFQAGQPTSNNCDTNVDFNKGCGVSFSNPASYGSSLNANGGGYYAIVRTRTYGVRIWFWPRGDPRVPFAVRASTRSESPDIFPDHTWGPPEVDFPLNRHSTCNYDDHFDAHQLVFDLTFCGDWAGSVYGVSGCGGSCTDLVDNNPEAFSKAYWEINTLRIFTPES